MDIMGGPEEGHTARRKTDDDEAEVIVVILDFGWGKKCGKKCKRREIGAGRGCHEYARATQASQQREVRQGRDSS